MRHHAIIAAGVGCLALTLLAQSTLPPTFRTGTRLVEVSVAATERGKPALDLTRGDFRVRDNGRDQEISFFIAPPSSNVPHEPGAGVEPNQLGLSLANEPGSAAIVLDWLNMGFAEQAYARQKTLDMLGAIGLNDRVALFTNMRTLGVLHDFTDNNAALLESLSALRSNVDSPSLSALFGTRDLDEFAVIDMQIRSDATQRNIQPVIEHLRRQPGKKSLIWISNSFYIPTADLIRANITLYMVDARGVQTKPLPPTGIVYGAEAQRAFEARMEQARRQRLKNAAESTGGLYFENRNDLDGAMREALDETRTSYTLGYYLPEDANPGDHKIKIDVNRRGVKLRYRESYLGDPAPAN